MSQRRAARRRSPPAGRRRGSRETQDLAPIRPPARRRRSARLGRKKYGRRRLGAGLVLLALLAGLPWLLWPGGTEVPKPEGSGSHPEISPPPSVSPPPSEISSPGFYPAAYDIEAEYLEDPRSISGTQRVRYVNAEGRPMGSLHFRLWTNEDVFTDLGGGTQVSGATVNGEPARTSLDGTDLEVKLPSPLADGEAAEVAMDFETNIPEIAAPFGHQPGVSSLGVWHPVLAVYDGASGGWNLPPTTDFGEPYFSEAADYEVSLTLPEDLTPVATGAERGRSEGGGKQTVRFEAESVRDFALAVGEDLSRRSRKVGGATVNVYYLPDSEFRAERALDLASRSLRYFSRIYGPYPYPELDLVDAPLVAGTEYSALAFVSMTNTDDFLFNTVVPHEVAHQWWYVQVGSDQFEEPWLDEALATYSEWLFAGDAETRFSRVARPGIPLGSPVDAFPDGGAYQGVVYLYGAQLFRDLSHEIGRETLLRGLRDYAREHRFGIATERDLIATLSDAAGEDLTPFFEARGVTPEDPGESR